MSGNCWKIGWDFFDKVKKTDRFVPVVTVVIYYGSEPWDGPVCLYDMLNLPEELKPFINNFKVNLVEARDNNLIFHNQNNKDLFSLLKIICDNSVDTKIRRAQIHDYESDHKIDKSVRMAIAATSKINLKKFEKEADVTMCKLWDDIRNEGKIEGKAEGKAEAIIEFMLEDSSSDDEIIGVLQKRMSITEMKATNYLKSYRENKL